MKKIPGSKIPKKDITPRGILKVDTHEGTSPCDHSLQLVPKEFTRRDWSQGLVSRTVHTKRFEEQAVGSCPKISTCLRSAHTMRPVPAGTTPIVCADLYSRLCIVCFWW